MSALVMEDGINFPTVVDLNVGGVLYTTSLNTLTKDTECLLGRMFSGKTPVSKDSNGRYFIDADGTLFVYILDFLRDREPILPQRGTTRDRLKKEAEFFELHPLVTLLSEQPQSEVTSEGGGGMLRNMEPQCITLHAESLLACMTGRYSPHLLDLRVEFVYGKYSHCKEVFGNYVVPGKGNVHPLNKHQVVLEKAFEACMKLGFRIVSTSSHLIGMQSFTLFHFARNVSESIPESKSQQENSKAS